MDWQPVMWMKDRTGPEGLLIDPHYSSPLHPFCLHPPMHSCKLMRNFLENKAGEERAGGGGLKALLPEYWWNFSNLQNFHVEKFSLPFFGLCWYSHFVDTYVIFWYSNSFPQGFTISHLFPYLFLRNLTNLNFLSSISLDLHVHLSDLRVHFSDLRFDFSDLHVHFSDLHVHFSDLRVHFHLSVHFLGTFTSIPRTIASISYLLCGCPLPTTHPPPPHSAPDVDAVILVQQWWVCGTQN